MRGKAMIEALTFSGSCDGRPIHEHLYSPKAEVNTVQYNTVIR